MWAILKTVGQLLHNQWQGRLEPITPSSMTKREPICTIQHHQPQWGRPLAHHPSKHTEDEFACAPRSVFRLFTGESSHRAHLECSSAQHATVINHYPCVKLGYTSQCRVAITAQFPPASNKLSVSQDYLLHMLSLKRLTHPSTVLPFLLPFLQNGHTESLGMWL